VRCFACGRKVTNDITQPNAAVWTLSEPRRPYCADSDYCRRDTEEAAQIVYLEDVENVDRQCW
jgi:hypothetical protein